MISLIMNLTLMSMLLSVLIKLYYTVPYFSENPTTTGAAAIMFLLVILWIFPKVLGLIIKFFGFCCIVFFICNALNIKFSSLKNTSDKAIDTVSSLKDKSILDVVKDVSGLENSALGQKVAEVNEQLEQVKMIVEPDQTFSATATHVSDGRELKLGDSDVTLYGIDVPDLAQNCKNRSGMNYGCGELSKEQLKTITQGQNLSCKSIGTNNKGKKVVSCTTDSGDDVAALMVRSGWAIADKKTTEKYVGDEIVAYKNKKGLWAGKFQEPQKWREANKNAEKKVVKKGKSKDDDAEATPFEKIKNFLLK